MLLYKGYYNITEREKEKEKTKAFNTRITNKKHLPNITKLSKKNHYRKNPLPGHVRN